MSFILDILQIHSERTEIISQGPFKLSFLGGMQKLIYNTVQKASVVKGNV